MWPMNNIGQMEAHCSKEEVHEYVNEMYIHIHSLSDQ